MKYIFPYLIFSFFLLQQTHAQTLELTSDSDGIGTEFTVLNTGAPINMINFIDYASGFTTGMNITVENDLNQTAGGLSYGINALAHPPIDNNTGDNFFNSAYSIYGDQSSQFGMTYAGYFAGDVTVTGTFSDPSDAKLKKQVRRLKNALPLLQQLQAKTYTFRNDDYQFMHLPKGQQFGLIAQEVEEVLPELVKQNIHPGLSAEEAQLRRLDADQIHPAVNYKSVNYTGFIPILIQGVNEQQEEIADLKAENEALRNEVEDLKAQFQQLLQAVQGTNQSQQTTLNSSTLHQNPDKAILKQNQPNPFGASTRIDYYLPTETKVARLEVSDVTGRLVKTYALVGVGHGTVVLEKGLLHRGTYFYTLYVDRQVVETMQMVVD